MLRSYFFVILSLVIILAAGCGVIQSPAPQPQLSATVLLPQATAMSALPATWTLVPTLTPSPTLAPSPTPIPTQDPAHYRIDLVMAPAEVNYPLEFSDRTGWTLIEGKAANFQVPSNFEVLDFAGVFVELMFGVMEAFVGGFVEFAGALGEEPQATPENIDLGELPEFDFLLAVEESSQSAIIMVSVERFPNTTTEDLLNEVLSDSDTDFQVISREIYLDSPFPMERVILDVVDEELGSGKQIIYAILGEQKAWNLVFTTPENLFASNLPLFESVVDSLVPLP